MKKNVFNFLSDKRVISAAVGISAAFAFLCGCSSVSVSTQGRFVRIAKITVNPAQIEQYNAYLKEEIADSLKIEKGVISLFAVTDKNDPARFMILEIYADEAAYQSHIRTPHFKKYKEGTLDMVTELEVTDVAPLMPEMKIKK